MSGIGGGAMKFSEIVKQAVMLLHESQRITYRALKREFGLDDDALEDLKSELIDAQRVARDEEGKVLVWVGEGINGEKDKRINGGAAGEKAKWEKGEKENDSEHWTPNAELPAAERRQLTVMFCDLVGSTALSAQLDPEGLREVVRGYQEMCSTVIRRYEGHIAQHLGDGLLVYFGYPAAHEDDAARAVRAGLEIVAALQKKLPSPFRITADEILPVPPLVKGAARSAGGFSGVEDGRKLQVRIGIHTGVVVIGEIGSSEKREMLALGETPNIASRVQGIANPDEVLISAPTYRLVEGLFDKEERGQPQLKGVATPLTVYRVVKESDAHSRFEVAIQRGLTPLVGREHEVGLLSERWERAKQAEGQVVLLSGEPGIGKSRLVQVMREYAEQDRALRVEFRCSPYHQNSAFYPIIEHLHRLLLFEPHDSLADRLGKLEQTLTAYRFPQAETLSLLAALLSLPHPADAPPLHLSPQRQKQKTDEALIAWLLEEAERAPLYCAWEDVHWADPSTLELLGQLIDQTATARLFLVLTSRPEFSPPWGQHGHLSQLTLSRLGRRQAPQMIENVASGKPLPADVVQQIVAKTDGVPLFVEELTKMVVESGLLTETDDHYELSGPLPPLAIPSTLQDSLMARLDRLATTKEIAQLGATIGREFTYELLHAVSPLNQETLQHGLRQLVDTELVFQSGVPPQARYLFKHALVQDTAYQSLLKSRRQQLHHTIGKVLEEQFPQTVETQPELVAYHYTEAGLTEQAIPYWHLAGQKASQRSAHVEAISHLTKGLDLLKTVPDTFERAQQELMLQIALGSALMVTKGWSAPELEHCYARAQELCRQLGETPQLFPVLFGLAAFRLVRGEVHTARELSEQLLQLAQSVQDPVLLVTAQNALGETLYHLGEIVLAREHLEQGIAVYDPQMHHAFTAVYGADQGEQCLCYGAYALWQLGYPDQALKRIYEALTLAQTFSHPFTSAYVLSCVALVHLLRREEQVAQERVEAAMTLSTEQGFPYFLAMGTFVRGRALVEQEQVEEGIAQMRKSLAIYRAIGEELGRAGSLAALTEAHRKAGQTEEGLALLAEALAVVNKTGVRVWEAELYRLKAELTLRQESKEQRARSEDQKLKNTDPRPVTHDPQGEAEACFLKAISVAQKQQAKSLELRAATSLARLWQHQGKRAEAHKLLSAVYHWFTEGFDTKDLQEAKALLRELQ
jgi:class 3 adenylate cyclase/predicted ATPase